MNWTAFKKFGEFSIYMELEFTYYKYAKQSKILRDRIKLTCLFLDNPFQIQHILCTYMNSNFKKDLILRYAFAFSLKIGNAPKLILFFSSKLRKFKNDFYNSKMFALWPLALQYIDLYEVKGTIFSRLSIIWWNMCCGF